MTITIDKDKGFELLERAVAEKGTDYVYPRPVDPITKSTQGCAYVRDGKPSCLVGHALFYVKPDIDMLTKFDNEGEFNEIIVEALRDEYDIDVSDDALLLLREAQGSQDRGVPWGKAVLDAKEWTERYPAH